MSHKITQSNQRGRYKTWSFASVLAPTHEARPACVSFICWRFSRVDAISWISNAKAKLPLPDLPFEGYIQSTAAIYLPRLHRWMPDAIWRNVSGRLHRSKAYQEFSAVLQRRFDCPFEWRKAQKSTLGEHRPNIANNSMFSF